SFHATALSLRIPPAGVSVSPLSAFVCSGHTGVTLFFVLSVFLISPPYLAATRGGARVRLGSYVRRRVLRIYPLYVVAVLVATALTAKHAYEALPHLVFLTPFASLAPPLGIHSGVWWSLSTDRK